MNKEELLSKVDEWITELRYEEKEVNTLKQYKNNVMKFINWLPDDEKSITKDTTMDYKDYIRTITESPKSMNIWIISI